MTRAATHSVHQPPTRVHRQSAIRGAAVGFSIVCAQVVVVLFMQRQPLHLELLVASGTLGTIATVWLRSELRGERLKRRRVRGECVRCGYDLYANESGVCPECGAPKS